MELKEVENYSNLCKNQEDFWQKVQQILQLFRMLCFQTFLCWIIGVLILYPITIIVLSVLSVLLMVTVWIWVSLIMVVCYIFNILVFQFESSNRPSGVLIRGVPLLSLAFVILSCLLQILFSALSLIIISPLVSLVYFLFLVIQRGLQNITDAIMIVINFQIRKDAQSRHFNRQKNFRPWNIKRLLLFNYKEDVYVLTQAKLERISGSKNFLSLTR